MHLREPNETIWFDDINWSLCVLFAWCKWIKLILEWVIIYLNEQINYFQLLNSRMSWFLEYPLPTIIQSK